MAKKSTAAADEAPTGLSPDLVGAILILDGSPLLVTAVHDDTVDGQLFGHGTTVHFRQGVTLGDEPGQAKARD